MLNYQRVPQMDGFRMDNPMNKWYGWKLGISVKYHNDQAIFDRDYDDTQLLTQLYMEVSINGSTCVGGTSVPNSWMVYFMEHSKLTNGMIRGTSISGNLQPWQ